MELICQKRKTVGRAARREFLLVVLVLCLAPLAPRAFASEAQGERIATVGQALYLYDMEHRLEKLIDNVDDLKIRIERYDRIDELHLKRHLEYLQRQLGHTTDLYLVLAGGGVSDVAELEGKVSRRLNHIADFVSYIEHQIS